MKPSTRSMQSTASRAEPRAYVLGWRGDPRRYGRMTLEWATCAAFRITRFQAGTPATSQASRTWARALQGRQPAAQCGKETQ